MHDAANNIDAIIIHTFDLDDIRVRRDDWRVFIDRRPDLYKEILTLDGENELTESAPPINGMILPK
ncbi:hypothetical protein [Wukongibacter sp. M2B1]|uniref:hypothetical protein n=1 Tax=Wukongibacter sp. M2B1 TaxID=3088895 RepID=UPI003D78FBE1